MNSPRSTAEAPRGFSLIEVMIAAALLALIAASLLSTMSFSSRSAARARARALASVEAQRVVDQILILRQVSAVKTSEIARFCDLVKASGGPLEGATGTCPTLTVTNKPIPDSTMTASITLVENMMGSRDGLEVTVTVTGGDLTTLGSADSVVVKSQFRR